MHSTEVEPEPHEVFFGLGLLIGEGRIPGLTSRGYGEGPHCSQFMQGPNAIKGHQCLADSFLCVREQNFRKHVNLLWSNSVPLCIEVLLCSNCQCGKDKSMTGEVSPLPDPAYVLLEQWTISSTTNLLNKRGSGAGVSAEVPSTSTSSSTSGGSPGRGGGGGRNLLQAVRSFLHFSQLSAWLSLSKGVDPKHIMYRVTMPGEDFASKFVRAPQEHEFPVANVKNTTLKVVVKSLPRSEKIPNILCSSAVCPVRSGKRSPMLSESLLDPSPMMPRRYQSPSRDSADHLMFLQRQMTIDDRLPSECSAPGKHNCTQGQEEDDTPQRPGPYPKVRAGKSTRISRRDMFLQSVNKRLTPAPGPSPSCSPLELVVSHCSSSSTSSISGRPKSSTNSTNGQEEEEACEELVVAMESMTSSTTSSRDASPLGWTTTASEDEWDLNRNYTVRPIPTQHEKIKFRKFLDSSASLVFHGRTGLPLTSSPAPLRKGQDRFDFDSSLINPASIKCAINKSSLRPRSSEASRALLGSFEESVLNGRIEPVSTVEGFTAEIGASGSFCPGHLHVPVTVFFYTFCDNDKVSTPYMAHINVGRKGYAVPRKGTVQVTLFNPLRTVIKMFVVMYDLSDMPADSQTFIRQRILYMPLGESECAPDAQKWLRYLIHLRFATSRSGRMFLHTDLRIVIFRKSDADTAMGMNNNYLPHELRSFTYVPQNPKYSPRFFKSKTSRLKRHLTFRSDSGEEEENVDKVNIGSNIIFDGIVVR